MNGILQILSKKWEEIIDRAIACDVISHVTVAIGHVGVLQLVDTMVLCVVLGCHNRSGRDKGISFFRIPAVITHSSPQDLELSKKRRNGLFLGRILPRLY